MLYRRVQPSRVEQECVINKTSGIAWIVVVEGVCRWIVHAERDVRRVCYVDAVDIHRRALKGEGPGGRAPVMPRVIVRLREICLSGAYEA